MRAKVVAVLGMALAVLAPPAARAADAIALPGVRAFPESVTATKDGTLYAGSFAQGGVVRVRPGSAPDLWVKPGADGTRSTFGVLADEAGGKLWVCSNDMSRIHVAGPSDVPGAWLKGFDLATGKLAVSARLPGDAALCNDIAVGPDGGIYVTNSLAPVVLRLNGTRDGFDTFATDPRFEPPRKGGAGLDGLAFDASGNLVVDLFNKATLFRIEVRDGKAAGVTALEPTRPLLLADAIRPDGRGGFLLIEGAGRLDRMTVDGPMATITPVKGDLDGPTGVAVVGTAAWVSEGRLSQLGEADAVLAGQPFRLISVPLAPPAP